MKRTLGILLLFPLLASSGLRIKSTAYDAGEVPEGKPIIHKFVLKNTGKKAISIKKVLAGCGCTTVNYDKTIPPGQQGEITLRVRTSGYQGKITKRAVVYTDDPSLPTITLSITAVVKPTVRIEPRRFIFLRKFKGETATSTVWLSSEKYPNFKITGISANPQNAVEAEFKREKGKWRVDLRFRGMKPGQNRGYIKIQTDIPEKPVLWINYLCMVEGTLKAMPTSLIFYRKNSGINYRVVTITSRDERARITLEKCPKHFRCFLHRVSGGYIFLISLEKPPSSPMEERLTFRSNVKGEEEITVNLKVR